MVGCVLLGKVLVEKWHNEEPHPILHGRPGSGRHSAILLTLLKASRSTYYIRGHLEGCIYHFNSPSLP